MEYKKVVLDIFKPRQYQLPACLAFESGIRKMILVWCRRSGKDVVAFNLMIREALMRVGNYAYCLPTYKQCKTVIWDYITNDGFKMLDFIPKDAIASINSMELRIILKNGSTIRLIGSDSYDTSLVGSNVKMAVLSEFALSDSDALKFLTPILNANDGKLIIISTPRGKGPMYDIFEMAKRSPDWFCQKLTIEDTNHIPLSIIQQDVDDGLVSEELVQQEYY